MQHEFTADERHTFQDSNILFTYGIRRGKMYKDSSKRNKLEIKLKISIESNNFNFWEQRGKIYLKIYI